MKKHYRKNEEIKNIKLITNHDGNWIPGEVEDGNVVFHKFEEPINVIERSELIYNVLKTNKKLIDAFLVGDYTSMENWRILLNNYIDEELKNKK